MTRFPITIEEINPLYTIHDKRPRGEIAFDAKLQQNVLSIRAKAGKTVKVLCGNGDSEAAQVIESLSEIVDNYQFAKLLNDVMNGKEAE